MINDCISYRVSCRLNYIYSELLLGSLTKFSVATDRGKWGMKEKPTALQKVRGKIRKVINLIYSNVASTWKTLLPLKKQFKFLFCFKLLISWFTFCLKGILHPKTIICRKLHLYVLFEQMLLFFFRNVCTSSGSISSPKM